MSALNSNASISIERAKPEQAKALTDICLRSKKSNGYDDAFMAACREELTIKPEDLRAKHWWVALDTDSRDLCGLTCLAQSKQSGRGEVHSFFIDPQWQRRGVGQLLWEHLRDQAKQLGLYQLVLDADPNAVPFYQAMGFSISGEAASGSIPGRMLPEMTIDLRSR